MSKKWDYDKNFVINFYTHACIKISIFRKQL